MSEKLATLTFSDGTPPIDFPVLSGSVGPDVIERATASTLQVLEHVASAHLVLGTTRAAVSYDELQLVVEITYEGVLLTLPNVGVRHRSFLEEESFSYGLADFLTGVYPDRMESSARGNLVTIRLYFGA